MLREAEAVAVAAEGGKGLGRRPRWRLRRGRRAVSDGDFSCASTCRPHDVAPPEPLGWAEEYVLAACKAACPTSVSGTAAAAARVVRVLRPAASAAGLLAVTGPAARVEG